MQCFEKEYEMLRAEILQYMEEYQTVRNMMYGITVSVLGINGVWLNNYYLFLLPMFVILPSFLNFYDYWRSVACASVYMQIFLEKDNGQQVYHWESRHREFSILFRKKKAEESQTITALGMHFQQIPYFVCGGLCLVLYWLGMGEKHIRPYIREKISDTILEIWRGIADSINFSCLNTMDTLSLIFDLLLGAAATGVCVYIGIKFLRVDDEEIRMIWHQVKLQEEEIKKEE